MVELPQLSPQTDIEIPHATWVVFSDDTDIKMLKLLRHGFRHCFIMMMQDNRWILIDPRSNKTDITVMPHPHHFNFPRYFSSQGKTVVKLPPLSTPRKILSPFPVSCVEQIKRIIGLHQWWVITPHQLYRAIQKIQKKGL